MEPPFWIDYTIIYEDLDVEAVQPPGEKKHKIPMEKNDFISHVISSGDYAALGELCEDEWRSILHALKIRFMHGDIVTTWHKWSKEERNFLGVIYRPSKS